MAIACTLTSAELRDRRAHIGAIAARSLRSRRGVPHGAQLIFEPAAESSLRELVALEAECCPFLTLDLRHAGDALELTVTGPDEAAELIEELLA